MYDARDGAMRLIADGIAMLMRVLGQLTRIGQKLSRNRIIKIFRREGAKDFWRDGDAVASSDFFQ
jgi:hypothetical protein